MICDGCSKEVNAVLTSFTIDKLNPTGKWLCSDCIERKKREKVQFT